MKKLLGVLLSPIHYLLFGLVLVVFHPIQWVAYNAFGYRAHKRVVDVMNWFLVATYYALGNTVTFINRQNLPTNRSIIFVANHQSTYDIPAMIYYLRRYHVKFISKIELTKNIPSISYNLKVGGGANIDRKDPRQSITELVKFGERMKQNTWSAAIFPEGTRSKDGVVRTFQSAGVATLIKKCPDALIVPVAIRNSCKVVRYGIFPLEPFNALRFEVLKPIETDTGTVAERIALAEERIREAVS